jgi:hypothetical protein
MSQKGEEEKEKISQLPDYYYDNRLSRESQLDENLKSLVRSRPVSQTFNQMSTHLCRQNAVPGVINKCLNTTLWEEGSASGDLQTRND